ncbi:MAG TPA: sodium/proline symporter PutP [Candidatus Hydrogenedentes bacterium]|nr:sodium/proline symporter PutP [Candidatus Hydrogenedentota bacterium]HPG68975.1 sodium/proline symporter PutP [Candidatus Hydrogenedentota bacterium]
MSIDSLSIMAVFFLYLAAMIAIGVFFYRRTESVSNYFLGDRKLNKWVTALSAQASDMSGWLLLGLPGFAYLEGLSAAWTALGLAVGTYLNWRCVARRLRLYTEAAGNAITLSDYFENRFRDHSKKLRVVSAVFIILFFLIYTASGFVAGGKLFSTVFGISYTHALLIGVVVVVSYTFLGGFNAVCWTDAIQGSLMFFAIAIVPFAATLSLGRSVTWSELQSVDPAFLDLFGSARGVGFGAGLIAIVSALAWGVGYFGQPHILARFMAIRSAEDITPSRRIAMTWVAIALAAAVAVGMIGRVYLTTALDGADSEKVFMLVVADLFPSVIAGVLLAAILAAIMSTADSQLLVTASALTEDIYRVFVRKRASDAELVRLSRRTVGAVAAVACLVALNPESSVFDLVAYAWAGFGAAFGPTIVLSLYWRRMNRQGALAGIVVGGVTALIWKHIEGGLFDLYEIVPGFAFSSVAIVTCSLLTAPPSAEIAAEFDAVNSGT